MESAAASPHLTRLLRYVFKGGDFSAKLVQFHCGSKLVNQHIPFGIVKVIFILLIVNDAALKLGELAATLGRWQGFEFVQKLALLVQAAF